MPHNHHKRTLLSLTLDTTAILIEPEACQALNGFYLCQHSHYVHMCFIMSVCPAEKSSIILYEFHVGPGWFMLVRAGLAG